MKGRLVFQAEEQAGKQAFHRNLDRMRRPTYVTGLLDGSFRQAEGYIRSWKCPYSGEAKRAR